MSDLHLECNESETVQHKQYDLAIEPRAPILALIGDIGYVEDYKDTHGTTELDDEREQGLYGFLERQLLHFDYVLYVMGNHEPYGTSWPKAVQRMKDFETRMAVKTRNKQEAKDKQKRGQFAYLDGITTFDFPDSNLTILGCTLFSHILPHQQDNIGSMISDFTHISEWDVERHNKAHKRDVSRLNSQVNRIPLDREIMILTHYAPTFDRRAINPEHWGSEFGSAFATDLRRNVCWEDERIKVWAFGHTHYNCDFVLERGKKGDSRPLRVVAEQKGYPWFDEDASSYSDGKVIQW